MDHHVTFFRKKNPSASEAPENRNPSAKMSAATSPKESKREQKMNESSNNTNSKYEKNISDAKVSRILRYGIIFFKKERKNERKKERKKSIGRIFGFWRSSTCRKNPKNPIPTREEKEHGNSFLLLVVGIDAMN